MTAVLATGVHPLGDAERKMVEGWHSESRRTHAAHAIAAGRYLRASRGFGAVVAALSAFVGGSLFATLSGSSSESLRIGTGVTSVLAAVLTAMSTYFGFGQMSEQHKVAAAKWGAIVRDLEACRIATATDADWQDRLVELRKEINNREADDPILSNRMFNAGQDWVERHPD